MKHRIKIIAFILFILTIIIVIYNIYDNNRIKVVYQDINIDELPESFNGFKILQISDLHGKIFGENQSDLIEVINSIDYDMIAITGDMGSIHNDDISSLTNLLDGLNNNEYIFYIEGNNGLNAINEDNTITEIGQVLSDKGCKFLMEPYEIKRGNDILYVSEFIEKDSFYNLTKANIYDDKSIKIALTHYPRHDYHYLNRDNIPHYDLVLAGHYHGGQWRLPFIGALFIPDVWSNISLFPKESEVSGLNTWGSYNQYVSRGLGASSKFSFLEFRLFNTPEINIITLY